MTNLPKFSAALLHPRYWLTWLGIGILWLIVQLPYPILYKLGCALGRLALRLMKRRAKIVSRNLELCFPQMSEQERQQMIVKNFESVGMGVMETGMAWFWSDKRISRWTEVIGMEHIRDVQAQKRGILLVGLHFLTLELGARQFGLQEPGIGVYRPNDNPLLDWLQTWGRMRSNKSMLDRKDLKGMIKALKKAKWSGTHRIMTTVPAPACLSRFLLLNRLQQPPGPGCFHACRMPAWYRLFPVASLTVKVIN